MLKNLILCHLYKTISKDISSWNNGQSPQDRYLWAELSVLQLYTVYLQDKDKEIIMKID